MFFTRSKIFLVILSAFILGVGFGSFVELPALYLFAGAVFGLVLTVVFWQYRFLRVIYFCLLIFALGAFRFQLDEGKKIQPGAVSKTYIGLVYEEPERGDNQKIKVKTEAYGNILITADLYPEYQYGDRIEIAGKVEEPKNFEGFDYKSYLRRYGIYLVSYKPKINLVSSGNSGWLLNQIYQLRGRLSQAIELGLKEPENSIFQAMALGLKKGITEETRGSFSKAGISHIIAISGLHITIIAGLIMNMALIYLSRRQAFWLAVFGLLFFILLVGAPASAVRAGIMGFLVLLAMYLGRLGNSANAFVLAAALMLLFNPKLLRYDIGFQLSFLAVLGLIYVGPYFESFFKKIPDSLNIKSTILMTLSAQVFTLPLIIYYFNVFSLIAPITNVLVLPILPFILISGFIATFLSLIYLPLGQVAFLPCFVLIKVVNFIATCLANLNWSSFEIRDMDFIFIMIIYVFILVFLKIIKKPLAT